MERIKIRRYGVIIFMTVAVITSICCIGKTQEPEIKKPLNAGQVPLKGKHIDSVVTNTWGDGIEEYRYDSLGRMAAVLHTYFKKDMGVDRVTAFFRYNEQGLITKEIMDKLVTLYHYDSKGRLTMKEQMCCGNGKTDSIVNPRHLTSTKYSYSGDRLIREEWCDSNNVFCKIDSFRYSKSGNISSSVEYRTNEQGKLYLYYKSWYTYDTFKNYKLLFPEAYRKILTVMNKNNIVRVKRNNPDILDEITKYTYGKDGYPTSIFTKFPGIVYRKDYISIYYSE